MMTIKRTIAAVAVSTLMLGTVSTGALILSTDVVYAKGNDKNDDRGNSGNKSSKSNGGSSKSKNASSNSSSGNGGGFLGLFKKKDKKPTQQTASVAPTTATSKAKPAKAVNRGALASELKGLNAAHANPNALANASPNSMVGKVAAYQAAVLNQEAIEELEAQLQTKLDEIIALEETYPDPSSESIQAEIDGINLQKEAEGLTEEQIAALDGQLNDLNTQLETTLVQETAIDDLIAPLQTVVDDLTEEIATLDAGTSPEDALDAATGGRELSPEALAELHRLLNLDPPEAEGEESSVVSEELEEPPVVQ